MPEANSPQVIHTHSTLSDQGHFEIGWDARDDGWAIPMLQKKIDEGYDLWIVRRDPVREVKLRTAAEIGDVRKVTIKDEAARILFEQGRIGIVAMPAGQRNAEQTLERRADSAEEASHHDTVAHRAGRGG